MARSLRPSPSARASGGTRRSAASLLLHALYGTHAATFSRVAWVMGAATQRSCATECRCPETGVLPCAGAGRAPHHDGEQVGRAAHPRARGRRALRARDPDLQLQGPNVDHVTWPAPGLCAHASVCAASFAAAALEHSLFLHTFKAAHLPVNLENAAFRAKHLLYESLFQKYIASSCEVSNLVRGRAVGRASHCRR